MSFQAFQKSQYPRRQWLVEGEPDTGKSTFAAQMKAPILPIDADHRFAEVVDLDEFSSLEEEQIARGERVRLPPHPFRKPLI